MKRAEEFLKTIEFVNVGTADVHGQPNVAPKFILKVEPHAIYLVDHIFGRSWENLKKNPRVSLSAIDMETLVGYRIDGNVQIVHKGAEYKALVKELRDKEVKLSAQRIIEGVSRERHHQGVGVVFPDRLVIYKVKIHSIIKICPSGKLKKERIAL